jgi:hypothetical protein
VPVPMDAKHTVSRTMDAKHIVMRAPAIYEVLPHVSEEPKGLAHMSPEMPNTWDPKHI